MPLSAAFVGIAIVTPPVLLFASNFVRKRSTFGCPRVAQKVIITGSLLIPLISME
jgi:hypothetical protein